LSSGLTTVKEFSSDVLSGHHILLSGIRQWSSDHRVVPA
jgi:hypothetical protein